MSEHYRVSRAEDTLIDRGGNVAEVEEFFDPENAEAVANAEDWVEKVERHQALIGQGRRADVLNNLEKIPDRPELGEVCIKVNVRELETMGVSHNDVTEEMDIQSQAYLLLEKARQQGVETAAVPQPICTIDNKYFVMDNIEGKTLWRRMLERVAERHKIAREDALLDDAFMDRLKPHLVVRPKTTSITLGPDVLYYDAVIAECERNPLLSEGQFEQVRNAVEILNQAGLFHRDLHPRNIMIDKEGGMYIIDFGTAIFEEGLTEAEAFNTQLGEKVAEIVGRDTHIITKLLHITKGFSQRQAESRRSERDSYFNRLSQERFPILQTIAAQLESGSLQNYRDVLELVIADRPFSSWLDRTIHRGDYRVAGIIFEKLAAIERRLSGTESETNSFIDQRVAALFPKRVLENTAENQRTIRRVRYQIQKEMKGENGGEAV